MADISLSGGTSRLKLWTRHCCVFLLSPKLGLCPCYHTKTTRTRFEGKRERKLNLSVGFRIWRTPALRPEASLGFLLRLQGGSPGFPEHSGAGADLWGSSDKGPEQSAVSHAPAACKRNPEKNESILVARVNGKASESASKCSTMWGFLTVTRKASRG